MSGMEERAQSLVLTHPRPCRALEKAKENSQYIDLLRILAQGNEASHNSPGDLQARKPPGRPHVSHDDLLRQYLRVHIFSCVVGLAYLAWY